MVLSLYPEKRRPYYVVTPRYVRTSAGIRALHLLVHWLNRCGEEAYIYIDPPFRGELSHPGLITPLLNEKVLRHHESEHRSAIVVYSETVENNILNAANIVRFFGHLPGHLLDLTRFSSHELDYSFSESIAKSTKHPENVLFIPTIDTNIFRPATAGIVRQGTCYYAAKYKDIHKGQVFGIPSDCFEIVRDDPNQLDQEELASLFRRSELLYCFEDSAIANEAALCGCPVVLMPNTHFQRPIAIKEVGWDGYAWGASDSEITRAKATISSVYNNYVKNIENFHYQLSEFVNTTQYYFERFAEPQKIYLPKRHASRKSDGAKYESFKWKFLKRIPFLGPHYERIYSYIQELESQIDEITEGNS
jgi:hypothetical protein